MEEGPESASIISKKEKARDASGWAVTLPMILCSAAPNLFRTIQKEATGLCSREG